MKLFLGLLLSLAPLSALAATPRIGTIVIRTDSLFSDEELHRGVFYRVLDHLHTRTREELVRAMLLFREGDPYDPRTIAQSETNLRRLDFIKIASITAGEPHDGVVDIIVRTQDEWTTDPNIDAGRGGGVGTWSMNLTQKDLFGTGAEVSVTDARNAERTVRSLEVLDPVFIRPYWNLQTMLSRNSDGGERKLLLEQPFYSQTASSSFSILIDDRSFDERLFNGGLAIDRFHAEKSAGHALFGKALTTGDEGSQRLFVGYESFDSRFQTARFGAFVPADHREQYVVAGYQFTRTMPFKLDYVDHDAKFDDFSSGVTASIFAGFGRGVDEVRAEIADGLALGGRGVLTSSLSYAARLRGRVENAITTEDVRFVWRFDTREPSSFVCRLRVDDGRNLDGDVQFFADELRGLRGYPNFAFAGTRAFVFNAEQRFFLGRELAQVMAPGFAVFFDAGAAATGGAFRPHRDAGAGLRFSLNRAESTVLRIDLVRDLDPVPGGRRRWAVSMGTSQAF